MSGDGMVSSTMSVTNHARSNYEKFALIKRQTLIRRLLVANRRDIIVRPSAIPAERPRELKTIIV